jgi:hypothetical protein
VRSLKHDERTGETPQYWCSAWGAFYINGLGATFNQFVDGCMAGLSAAGG